MLGKISNQSEIHTFDVCGRVYYSGACYERTQGQLVAETVEASSHDEAEAVFQQKLLEHADEFDLVIDRVQITFTLDLTVAERSAAGMH